MIAAGACAALLTFGICSATALAATEEVPPASSVPPGGAATTNTSSATAPVSEEVPTASSAPAVSSATTNTSPTASTTEEVPTASSALAVSGATTNSTEAVGSVTSTAATTVSASCEGQTFGQPFEAFGDENYYTLVPGSQFNGPEEGWTLSGGAKIVSVTRPDGSSGGVLQLPKGSEAVSPPMCVTLLYPTARLWAAAVAETRGSVKTQVVYSSAKGVAVARTVAKLQPEAAWSPSEAFEVRPELGGNKEGPRPVRFVFAAKSDKEPFDLYDLYVDPRMR